MRFFRIGFFVATFMIAMVVLTGCTLITVIADPPVVKALRTSTITATVTDEQGSALPNETVTFEIISGVDCGSLSSPTAITGPDGRASVTFQAGLQWPCTAVIKATCLGRSDTCTVTVSE